MQIDHGAVFIASERLVDLDRNFGPLDDLAFQQVSEELNRLRQKTGDGPPLAIGRRDQVIPWPFPRSPDGALPPQREVRAEPEDLPHLSTRSHVKPAVGKLGAAHVRQVGAQFGLALSGTVADCRARVVEALCQPETLARAVEALDDTARSALGFILDSGGWYEAKPLAQRFDGEPVEPPWHASWGSPSMLAPLRHWGLVYLGRVNRAGRARVAAVVPVELRGPLASALARR